MDCVVLCKVGSNSKQVVNTVYGLCCTVYGRIDQQAGCEHRIWTVLYCVG